MSEVKRERIVLYLEATLAQLLGEAATTEQVAMSAYLRRLVLADLRRLGQLTPDVMDKLIEAM